MPTLRAVRSLGGCTHRLMVIVRLTRRLEWGAIHTLQQDSEGTEHALLAQAVLMAALLATMSTCSKGTCQGGAAG